MYRAPYGANKKVSKGYLVDQYNIKHVLDAIAVQAPTPMSKAFTLLS